MELKLGAITNLGIGILAGIPSVAAEEGMAEALTLSIESGITGGIPAQGGDFGLAYNAEAIIEQSFQFDFYDGGGLDASFLGLAQVDASGNVNVSKFNGRPVGCGGFVNITRPPSALVFCGSFTAGGLSSSVTASCASRPKAATANSSSRSSRSPSMATTPRLRGQQVIFVTERAVFHLRPEGIEPTEIAPGIDLDKDVLAHMEFSPDARREAHGRRPLPRGLGRAARGVDGLIFQRPLTQAVTTAPRPPAPPRPAGCVALLCGPS